MKIDTILVATDFSPDSERAVEVAADCAKTFDAEVVVVHAYHVDIPLASPNLMGGVALPPDLFDQMREQAQRRVDEVAERLRGQGLRARSVALAEPAPTAIVAEAEQLSADLVVVGTRGHTGLKHVLLGSVAERVVRTAPCSVLTVKSTDE